MFETISLGRTALWTCLTLLLVPIIKLVFILLGPYFSDMRSLPGPPGGSWITGHISELNKSETDRAECHLQWVKQYGHVYVYKSLLNSDRLTTVDPKALNHILANSMVYYKPSHLRLTLGQLIGEGLIFSEGAAHKRQRKVMNPSFSLGHIKAMTQVFLEKALELRDSISSQIMQTDASLATINIIPPISRCTLDIIGLAGFNYNFDTMKDGDGESTNELASAFAKSNRTDSGYAMMQLLLAWIPPLRWVMFDEATRTSDKAQKTMRRIGRRLVEDKKRALGFVVEDDKKNMDDKTSNFSYPGSGKDLLSLLIKANMDSDVAPEQRMSDEEVMHQIPTFMVAGHETTATALTWAMFCISTHLSVQQQLREELNTLHTDTPTLDELHSLKFFDAVVKECLRLYPSFENTLRIAQSDDVVPVEKPFVDRHGKMRDRIIIKKGDGVMLPILLMNRLESIWGPDAAEFRPERWDGLPASTSTVPGVWGNQFSFLGGPRSCIGYRFAIAEMKAILYTLFRAFTFELAVDEKDVLRASAIVTRPMVRGQVDKGTQMPLLVRSVANHL